jgi:hypothetical protein
MIAGSGWVNLISGRIRCYRVGFHPLHGCVPGRPLGRDVGRLGRAGHTREKAGWATSGFQPIKLGKIENPFSFSILFINFKRI